MAPCRRGACGALFPEAVCCGKLAVAVARDGARGALAAEAFKQRVPTSCV